MKDLGTLGSLHSFAMGINNKGQIVGGESNEPGATSTTSISTRAFLHSDGTTVDLGTKIDPATGWLCLGAGAINDVGQIIGFGMAPDKNLRAYLLTPRKGLEPRD
jgi:probable HAF family extracellular repeat protein